MADIRNLSFKTQTGFTLIELVMVMVLIGVLSYGASSLFASRDAYSSFVAKDQLISQALFAQQIALGGRVSGHGAVELSVAVDGSDWVMTVTKPFDTSTTADDQVLVRRQESTGGQLFIDGTEITSGNAETFTWNDEGSLSDGANHNVLFSGDSTHRVCLSASGYTYASATGTCP